MNKKHSAEFWANIFGIEIIDPDGWRHTSRELTEGIDLAKFLDRIVTSTIRPINKDRYAVLNALL